MGAIKSLWVFMTFIMSLQDFSSLLLKVNDSRKDSKSLVGSSGPAFQQLIQKYSLGEKTDAN